MRPADPQHLARWLDAEAAGRPDAADEALTVLLHGLPELAPPRGFADRVLLRARRDGVLAARSGWSSPWLRAALAGSTAALTAVILLVPGLLSVVGRFWDTGGLVRAGIDVVAESAMGLAKALRLGDLLITLGRAFALPLLTPDTLAAVVLCLAIAGLALRFLRELSLRERSWTYVQSI
jgi:hypothetical protein